MILTPIDPRTLLSATKPTLDAAQKKQQSLIELRNYTREFEALYINELFKAMRKTIPESGLFEKDMAQEMYEESLDMERARTASSGSGIGIGEAMYDQLRHLVENKLVR